ncbi:HTH domain-containing protein [Ligilactobacillus faecis]|uniref:HTH domain-containing protein n=1 Tax=Ligilactobacillus faecis TaxID=762833 RepID=A0ABV4DPJ2_9LACO
MKKEKMKALLDILLQKTDYVTSKDLTQQFSVSQETVIR